jgi:hypothetical protein
VQPRGTTSSTGVQSCPPDARRQTDGPAGMYSPMVLESHAVDVPSLATSTNRSSGRATPDGSGPAACQVEPRSTLRMRASASSPGDWPTAQATPSDAKRMPGP